MTDPQPVNVLFDVYPSDLSANKKPDIKIKNENRINLPIVYINKIHPNVTYFMFDD